MHKTISVKFDMGQKGLVHIYIGGGQGKTSAAIGLALRAHGARRKVCLIQFLKARSSSEIGSFKKLGIDTVLFKEKHPLFYKSASIKKLKEQVALDLKRAEAMLRDKKYNFIVLDEVLYLLKKNLAKESDIIRLIRSKRPQTELIMTGPAATSRILSLAHYVSNIRQLKHPLKKGIQARRGIEY